MARETVAQRNARYAQERETYLANQVAEYPQRLMNVLARATNAYFELSVVDNKFQVQPRDSYARTLTLAYAHSPNSQAQLESLESELDHYEAELAERKRVAEVKKEALRKVNELLTAEERELLNL
jgi:conjugal transfer/entry exclusion protein